jgi:hypothetical protein
MWMKDCLGSVTGSMWLCWHENELGGVMIHVKYPASVELNTICCLNINILPLY